MSSSRFEVHAKTLKDLLISGNPTFEVPHYQRTYSWTKEHVDQLWTDLLSAIDEKEQEYFLGATVLIREGHGKYLIIDGQQRIATLTVILAVLRDFLYEQKEHDAAEKLHQLVIRTTLKKQTEPILLLTQDIEGQHFREQIQPYSFQRKTKSETKPRRRGRPKRIYIKEAYEISENRLKDDIVNYGNARDKIDRLTDIASFIMDHVVIITTMVASDTDAYTVFETLNDRGLDLSIADLLKNHLFSLGQKSKRLRDMQNIWEQITTHLDGIASFSRFLRHYWLSKHSKVTERKLYAKIKEHLRTNDAFKFASELENEAALYSQLVEPSATDPNALDLLDLKNIGIHQHLPLLLAERSKGLSSVDFKKLLSTCCSLTMRHQIVGERNPNQLESSYSEWAIRLRNGGKNIIDSIIEEAMILCPEDAEFTEGFKQLENLRSATARYILRKINEQLSGTEMSVRGPSDVHIEHILPLNPSTDWESYIPKDKQAAKALAKRLGNLTLLSKPLNKQISNRGFDKKKNSYEESQINITRELLREEKWDEQAIQKRQEDFADLAPIIWVI